MLTPSMYYLGMPLWAHSAWKGSLFSPDAKPNEFLQQYAQVFNAVEGNTTFYSVPSIQMVERWLAVTPEDFRFSFKLPRAITHQQQLQYVQQDVSAFFQRLQPLGERLNGVMIQLPASFSPESLHILQGFIYALPAEYHYAVEVRHPAFFTQQDQRDTYNALLHDLGVDRVIFESRPVHAAVARDAATQEAQQRKPRLPVQLDTTGQQPVLRYIGHPELADNAQWLDRWVAQTARWIEQGLRPRVFIHTPNNDLAPKLAQHFHQQLQLRIANLPDLPSFGLVQHSLL